MRDPKRIKPFLAELGECWQKVPDWRFGQLIANFCYWLGDPFFYEDDELIKKLKEYFKER